MNNAKVHICRFDTTSDIRPARKRTYDAIKQRVLEAGRFSIFEATENARDAWRFQQLHEDPELETYDMGFPWIGVRRKAEGES